MKRNEFDVLAKRLRNWDRWGNEDQRGTLNHIIPKTLKAAAETVQAGKVFSLGLRFDKNGPQIGDALTSRFNPELYATELGKPINPAHPSAAFSDDHIRMPLQCATQWDALGHMHYDGVMYNGCKASDVLSSKGAARLGVEHMSSPGIMSRGVLLDIARLKGVDSLLDDYAISVDDLIAACVKQNVEVGQGDVLLIRTGHMRRFTVYGDRAGFSGPQCGVSAECAEWVHDKSIAAIAADNLGVEIISREMLESEMPMPFHMLCLRDMGCPLGEMFDMEALAADCAVDGRYAFLLSAPALAVTGAFGSPVNPLALK
jgi:kynurenine formamidase